MDVDVFDGTAVPRAGDPANVEDRLVPLHPQQLRLALGAENRLELLGDIVEDDPGLAAQQLVEGALLHVRVLKVHAGHLAVEQVGAFDRMDHAVEAADALDLA